eukprot:TRINITY_DN17432_c0_g1_i1.p1 TRINITY_DN17432_c0_g1~~TRINITY_DN17432_c0_g1_i1.p1  ORF type:complete len:406 (+),score=93.04 TRINITY_DN17432_c0_g1_i1:90-1220(+)
MADCARPPRDGACAVSALRARRAQQRLQLRELRSELEAARQAHELLRLRLLAAGVSADGFGVVPGALDLRAGSPPGDTIEQLKECLIELVPWLADNVDMSKEVVFNACGELSVGKHSLKLGRMASWPLAADSGLRFSVPLPLREEVAALLKAARGRPKRSGAAEALAAELSDRWDMVCADMEGSTPGEEVSAILLMDPNTSSAMVVSNWPDFSAKAAASKRSAASSGAPASTGSGDTAAEVFDHERHFNRSLRRFVFYPPADEEGGDSNRELDTDVAVPSESSCSGAHGRRRAPAPPKPIVRRAVAEGDRVEALYDGEWYTGVLRSIEGTMANVQCDVDLPGVMTTVPLFRVRLVQLLATIRSLSEPPGEIRQSRA